MKEEKEHILNLINFHQITELLEQFYKITGFPVTIMDLEGKILAKSDWHIICENFHRANTESLQLCKDSDAILANKMQAGEKYHFYKCKNGLVDVAVPIIINDIHIANLYSGQFLLEKPDKKEFLQRAERFHLDKEKYMKALDEVPIVEEEQARKVMDFLLKLTMQISTMIMQKVEMSQLLEKLNQNDQVLQATNQQLSATEQQVRATNQQLIANEKELEQSLSEAQLWADIVLKATVGVAIGYPDGKLGISNKAYQKITGYTQEELTKIDWNTVLTPPEWLPKELEKLKILHETKKAVTYEKEYLKKDGKRIPVELTVHARINKKNEVTHYYAFVTDITERKKNEEDLKAKTQLLSDTGEMARVGGWEVDLETNKLTWSEETYKIHEIPMDQVPPIEEAINFFHPDDRLVLQKALKNAIENGKPYDLTLRFITAKGKHLITRTICQPQVENGKVVKLKGTFQDVTDWKKAEEKLMVTNQQLNAANQQLQASEEELRASNQQLSATEQQLRAANQQLQANEQQLKANNLELIAFNQKLLVSQKENELKVKMLNQAPLIIAHHDLNHRIVWANKAYLNSTNLTLSQVKGRKCWEVWKLSKPCDNCPVLETIQDGESHEFLLTPENQQHWPESQGCWLSKSSPILDNDGNIVGVIETALNFTEKVKNDKKIIESEQLLRSYFEHAPYGLFIADKNGFYLDVNKAATEITGFSRDELLNMHLSELIPPNERYLSKQSFDNVISTGFTEAEIHFVKKDGSIGDWQVTAVKINENRFLGFVQDITKRKQTERDIKKIEWLLEKETKQSKTNFIPEYGDVTLLNTEQTILNSVGKEMLSILSQDVMDLLDTSVAVYEKNGDYAFGMFASGWCQIMDSSSRKLCDTKDNAVALSCGKWLCHENCWNQSAKPAIVNGKTTDIHCIGGIKLYAEPIFAGDDVVGAINIGYTSPPEDKKILSFLAEKFAVDIETLQKISSEYKMRPPFIIEIAKKRLKTIAKMIGDIVHQKRVEKELETRMEELEIFNTASVGRELMINNHRKEINELLKELGREAKYEIVE